MHEQSTIHKEMITNQLYNNDDLKQALDVLHQGGVILYPTDTIWGLGCDATNAKAVEKVFKLKNRPDAKSMILLLDNEVKLPYYVKDVPDIAWDLISMANKPLTIVYDDGRGVAERLIAPDGSIGIRITQEMFSKQLCNRFRKAIVSTSANVSGKESPSHFAQIDDYIKKNVDYVVKYRQDESREVSASSIIKLKKSGEIKIIRP